MSVGRQKRGWGLGRAATAGLGVPADDSIGGALPAPGGDSHPYDLPKFLSANVIGRLQCSDIEGWTVVRVVEAIGFVAAGGGIGGMSAYLSSAGLRRRVSMPEGPSETSIIVAALIGAIAAAASWVMQPGNAALTVLGDLSTNTGLTLQDVGAAFGVGLVGSKWLTNHNKAEMLQHAAARVALRPEDPEASIAMASGDPRRIKSALTAPPSGDGAATDPAASSPFTD